MNYTKLPVIYTFEEAAKEKTFFSGTNRVISAKRWLLAESGVSYSKVDFSPRMFNHINELIINACDQYNDMINDSHPVRDIIVNMSGLDCEIYNSGMGFPIGKDGEYVRDALMKEYCSSNHGNKDTINGGVNGLGLKVVVFNCKSFRIHTIDTTISHTYIHEFRSGQTVSSEHYPKIIPIRLDETDLNSGTLITLSLEPPDTPDPDIISTVLENMCSMIRMRIYETGIYYNTMGKLRTVFNKIPIRDTFRDLIKSIDPGSSYSRNSNHGSIHVGVCVANMGAKYICIINSIETKCNMANIFYKAVKEELLSQLARDYSIDKSKISRIITRNLFLVIMAQVSQKCYNPNSQSKDSLVFTCKECTTFKPIVGAVKGKMGEIILEKASMHQEQKTTLKKHEKAKYSGTIKSNECKLFITEGDSASTCIRNILNDKACPFHRDYCGLLSITGVPQNIVEKIRDIKRTGDKQVVSLKNKYTGKGLQDIEIAVGLNRNRRYSQISDINSLKYGEIVLAFDQDLDGIGNICSLIIAGLGKLYPELFKFGVIKRLKTPIISVYQPSGGFKAFYSESEFIDWNAENEERIRNVLYLKGLGSCTVVEIDYIRKNINNLLVTYELCPEDGKYIDMFYQSSESDERKAMISGTHDNIESKMRICIHEHLRYYCVQFYRYKNARQIPSYIDGLNIVQRKIIFTILKYSVLSVEKVMIMSGDINKKTNYSHGDSSINNAICMLSQAYMGARNFPFLAGSNGAGNIDNSRDNIEQARYVYLKPTKIIHALFPDIDNRHLQYREIDGKICEPHYYVPILPLSILELFSTTGAGWKITTFPRSLKAVISNVCRKLMNIRTINLDRFSWNYPGLTSRIRKKNGFLYSYLTGSYEWTGTEILIRQLVPQCWVVPYIEKLRASEFGTHIKIVNNYTESNVICIRIEINKSSRDEVSELHRSGSLEKILHLGQICVHQLNMINEDETITSFDSYNDIFEAWFRKRLQLYGVRIEYNIRSIKDKIEYYQNILRFITNDYDPGVFKEMDDDSLDEYYSTLSYPLIDGTYDYLNNITIKQTTQRNISRLKAKIVDLNRKLSDAISTTPAALWLREIRKFVGLYNDGIKSKWLYEMYNVKV